MRCEYVAAVTPPKLRVTWATSWGRLQELVGFIKNWKTSALSTTDGWLTLNFASCVIRQTHSLGVLVLCSNWNIVFVNYIDDMVVHTQFHKFYGRPFARDLYLFLMKDVCRWLPWVLPGSTGRFYKDDLLFKYCPVVLEVKIGRPTYCTACFPRIVCCYSQKNSVCWIVHSNQVRGALPYYIKERYHRRSRRSVVQMHGTIREDRTSPVNPTWTGHRMVCNLWQGVYYSSPHKHSDVLR